MAATEAYWRRIWRALLVCLVAVTVLAPSFDSLLCLDEDFAAVAAAEHAHGPSDSAQLAQADADHEDAAPGHGATARSAPMATATTAGPMRSPAA